MIKSYKKTDKYRKRLTRKILIYTKYNETYCDIYSGKIENRPEWMCERNSNFICHYCNREFLTKVGIDESLIDRFEKSEQLALALFDEYKERNRKKI